MKNIAFIDGQNLHYSSKTAGLNVDLFRFRIYLTKKYDIETAFYYLGNLLENNEELYDEIQKAGFILKFREHGKEAASLKKGNVDTDIVFEMMRSFAKDKELNKILLVSGDGDYFKTVNFLIKENKFLKILFPNTKSASSLYKKITAKYFDFLERDGVKNKITKD